MITAGQPGRPRGLNISCEAVIGHVGVLTDPSCSGYIVTDRLVGTRCIERTWRNQHTSQQLEVHCSQYNDAGTLISPGFGSLPEESIFPKVWIIHPPSAVYCRLTPPRLCEIVGRTSYNMGPYTRTRVGKQIAFVNGWLQHSLRAQQALVYV